MKPIRDLCFALGGALMFGLAAGLIHGNEAGFRASLANLSAPWLMVPLITAWRTGSAVRGALLGTVTTAVALVGFYVGLTTMMYGHIGGIEGALPSFEFVLRANVIWFKAGLVSGPLFGAVGGAVGHRLGRPWLMLGIGALMTGELLVVRAIAGVTLPLVNVGWATPDMRGYLLEAGTGVVLALVAVRAIRRPAAHPAPLASDAVGDLVGNSDHEDV